MINRKIICKSGSRFRLNEGHIFMLLARDTATAFCAVCDGAPFCCSVHLLIHVAPSSMLHLLQDNSGGVIALVLFKMHVIIKMIIIIIIITTTMCMVLSS